MTADEEVASLRNLSTQSEWRTSHPDRLTRRENAPSFNRIGGWLCPGMGRFRTENIWCPCWESRFPNRPNRSLFSTPTDAILDVPLSIMYLNNRISAYTTNFNSATCSIRKWEDGIRNDMEKMKIKNWTSYIQDRNKWKLYVEKAKTFKDWSCSA